MTTLGLSIANLRSRRLRTAVSLLSLAVACAMLSLSLSATIRMRSAVNGFDEHSLFIGADLPIPLALAHQIGGVLGPSTDVQWNIIATAMDADRRVELYVLAGTDGYFLHYPTTVVSYVGDARKRWLAERQGVMVSGDLMRRLGWKVGDWVTVYMEQGPVRVHVVGVTGGTVTVAIFPHFEFIDQLMPKHGQLSTILVRAAGDPDATIQKLTDHFVGSEPPLLVMHHRAVHEHLMALSGILPDLLEKISIVFGLSTLFVLLSNAFVSLRERRIELGALRAIGFTRRRTLAMLVAEFVTTCTIAGLLGCGIPYALFHSEGIRLGDMALDNVRLNGPACAAVFLACVLLGGMVTLVPALLTVRLRVLELIEPR
jgi:predicted lysophospholipase L1 biosynthesis ABC-type transport system permease subunit